jgi:hypothetical protein
LLSRLVVGCCLAGPAQSFSSSDVCASEDRMPPVPLSAEARAEEAASIVTRGEAARDEAGEGASESEQKEPWRRLDPMWSRSLALSESAEKSTLLRPAHTNREGEKERSVRRLILRFPKVRTGRGSTFGRRVVVE